MAKSCPPHGGNTTAYPEKIIPPFYAKLLCPSPPAWYPSNVVSRTSDKGSTRHQPRVTWCEPSIASKNWRIFKRFTLHCIHGVQLKTRKHIKLFIESWDKTESIRIPFCVLFHPYGFIKKDLWSKFMFAKRIKHDKTKYSEGSPLCVIKLPNQTMHYS